MLKVQNVTRSFHSAGTKVTAVNDVSFDIPDGTFASIIGKSGSGKSTLLALLGALDKPTSGNITIDDSDIARIPESQRTAYRRNKIGFVFQNYHLIPNLSALENVMLPMELAGRKAADRRQHAMELLDKVGLEGDKQSRRPGRLSGGEQQRVAIARALANRPSLVLADEPTGNLDEQTGRMIFDLLHQLSREENVTIVAVTHDLGIAGKTDVAFKLRDGRLVSSSK